MNMKRREKWGTFYDELKVQLSIINAEHANVDYNLYARLRSPVV